MEEISHSSGTFLCKELLKEEGIKSEIEQETQDPEKILTLMEFVKSEDYDDSVNKEFVKQEDYCYYLKQENYIDSFNQVEQGDDHNTFQYEDVYSIDSDVVESDAEKVHVEEPEEYEPVQSNILTNNEEDYIYISDSSSSDNENNIVADDSSFSCERCNKSFKRPIYLARHKCVQHVTCNLCGKVLSEIYKLKDHLFQVHRLCKICGIKLGNKSVLKRHYSLCKSNNVHYKCNKCNKVFKTKSYFKRHVSQHKHSYFKCDVCNTILPNEETLQEHIKHHSPDMRYKCSTCCLLFETKNKLILHQQSHVKKPYKCCICHMCFITEENLSLHSLIHDYKNVSVTKCRICKVCYCKPSDYIKHYNVYHRNI